MNLRISALTGLTLLALGAFSPCTRAQDVLVLNGNGVSAIAPTLTAAGFNVISGTLDPGQISTNLAANPGIVEVWIWSDYTYGNGGIPADPLRDFDAQDLADLAAFSAAHPHWIFDGLAWRQDVSQDEIDFTTNEGLDLLWAGGGIVLGADDASGSSVVQHPNQVCAYFGFTPFEGVFSTHVSTHVMVASGLSGPLVIDPTQISSTSTYTQVPHGLQPNGIVLSPAIFAWSSNPSPGYVNPPLPDEVLGGILQHDVNHLVTTTLPGGSQGDFAPLCFGDGTGTSCPCGNAGLPGYGCDNSLATGGGILTAIGTPNVTLDDFTLQGSNMPPSATTLYFQGTVALNLEQGLVFGDGLRCVGGAVIRLVVKFNNAAGSSIYPDLTIPEPLISIAGAIPLAGGTRFYQAWYRNAPVFCTPATFNLTNGLGIVWTP